MTASPRPAAAAPPSLPALFDLAILVGEKDFDSVALEQLLLDGRFDHIAGRVTALVERGGAPPAAGPGGLVRVDVGPDGLSRAIGSAVEWRRHLLVVSVDTIPSLDCVGRLTEAFDLDPLIGFAVPRFATSDGESVFPLTADAEPLGLPTYPWKVLSSLPGVYLCPEVLSAVVLMRREALTGVRKVNGRLQSALAALLATIIQGRRLGYRTAIVNRAIVPARSRDIAYPTPDAVTLATIADQYPCHAVAQSWFAALSAHRREAILAGVVAAGLRQRPRLLLDIRGMGEFHNGTSAAILGMVDGLAAVECDWEIDLLATSAAASWHDLQVRYPNFGLVLDHPAKLYTVAVRLSQPWSLSTLAELHAHALKIAVTMLDTIMWDAIYPCAPSQVAGLGVAWEFAASHLDGLLFISEYSRRRFNFRFPGAPHVRQLVSSLSFAAADYGRPHNPGPGSVTGDILIFGNDYDHKWTVGAVEWIADGFPLATITAVGLSTSTRSNVHAAANGQLTDDEIKRLYAGAKILCFPSYYEGFGLPIVEGLAHGLDVVARRSELLDEIAAQYRGPGRILPFDDPLSLLEAIGRSLTGAAVDTLALGTQVPDGQSSMNWKGVAARIMTLVDAIAADADPRIYDIREAALRMLRPDRREPS
jgi:glycosyl transferase family 1